MKYVGVIATLILAIYSISGLFNWNELNTKFKVISIIALIAAILLGIALIAQIREDYLKDKVQSKIGDLNSMPLGNNVTYQIGKSGAKFLTRNGVALFGDHNKAPLLATQSENGKLFIYAIVRNEAGKVVAVIDRNTWTVFSSDYEYNNDDTAFELVKAGERTIYFQIEIVDNIICFKGALFDESGSGMYWTEHATMNGGIGITINNGRIHEQLPANIKNTIFQYPREKYLGVRRGVK